MYEVDVLFCDETNEARPETQQSVQNTALPTNSSDGLTHVELNWQHVHDNTTTKTHKHSADTEKLLKVVSTEETTSRPTSLFKTLLSGTVTGKEFSPTPCGSLSWSLFSPSSLAPWLPIDGLPPTLSFATRPSTHPGISLVPQGCRWSIQSSLSALILPRIPPAPWVLKLGSLLKNSHDSFFVVWKRCFSSTCVSRILDSAAAPLASHS